MLVIDTYLAPDEYGGRGVFARVPVKKGDVVWRFSEANTRVFTLPEYAAMLARRGDLARTMKTYCYPAEIEIDGAFQPVLFHDQDNGSFINHNDTPNAGYINDPAHPHFYEVYDVNIALRDIAVGEQITFDYFDFVEDHSLWNGVETCMQFLFDMGRYDKTPLKKSIVGSTCKKP